MAALDAAAVRKAMLQKLRASLLTEAHAKKLKLQPMTEEAASKAGVQPPWAGFRIPYFTPEGHVVPDFYRYRFWPESKPSKGWASIAESSKLRYVQPANSELHVYMPPLLKGVTWRDVMQYAEQPVFITEGELKAACMCANTEHIMLGLGGVFSWMSKRHEQVLLPILEEFQWAGRDVYICFDSDQNTKPLVQLAASRLALVLTARGAQVHEVHLPAAEGGAKQGVDDYLAACGAEAFSALLEDPLATQPVRHSLELHRMNEEVAVIWGGGPAGNLVRIEDGRVLTPAQFTRTLYRDRVYFEFRVDKQGKQGTPEKKYAAEEWLAWPYRARVRGVTYLPGQPQVTDEGDYNLWRGGGVAPARGDVGPWEDLLARMFRGADPAAVMWLRRWLAWPLRHPGAKLFSCVLVWSYAGGTGKNLLAESMVPLYGAENVTVINSTHLTSDFNNWAEGRQFIIGDEITLDDKRHTSGVLKSMLTNKTVRINRKGIEAYEIPDCTNYYFTSNEPLAIMLEQGERRTFVQHVAEEPVGDRYGAEFKAWLYGCTLAQVRAQRLPAPGPASGAAALRHHLDQLDLGDFSPTAPPPDTTSKLELIANSRSDVDNWAAALALEPERWLGGAQAKYASDGARAGPYDVYTPDELLRAYDPDDKKRCSLRALGIALERAGFRKARDNNGRAGNTRSVFWLIRNDDRTRAPISGTEAARRWTAERPERFRTAPREAPAVRTGRTQ